MLKQLFAPAPTEPATMNGARPATPGLTSTVEFITPETAKSYLARNIDNQPLKTQRVSLFRRTMEQLGWAPGQAIIALFGLNEMLGNGQHTLTAIVQSGLGQWCTVIRDPSLSSPRDWLGDSLRGPRSKAYTIGYTDTEIAVAKFAYTVCGDSTDSRDLPTDDELRDMCGRLDPFLARITRTSARHLSTASARLAVITQMKLHTEESGAIAERYHAFITGHVSELPQSLMGVRDHLLMGRLSGGRERRMEILIRCLAAFDPTRDGNARVIVKDFNHRTREAKRIVRRAWMAGEGASTN